MSPSESFPRPDRRTAIKWMLTAAAGLALLDRQFVPTAGAAEPSGKGYGTDPLLNKTYAPGDVWPLTLSEAQRRTAAVLCGLIIPAEAGTPSAADLAVHDFIDEWISAPYPAQQRDRPVIIHGLSWINGEARRRFGRDFAELPEPEMTAICDDICHAPEAKPEHAEGARFFARFRDLTAGGFYTTPAGMKDVGYVGNLPLAEFKGPPREVLEKLGLA